MKIKFEKWEQSDLTEYVDFKINYTNPCDGCRVSSCCKPGTCAESIDYNQRESSVMENMKYIADERKISTDDLVGMMSKTVEAASKKRALLDAMVEYDDILKDEDLIDEKMLDSII